MISTLLDAKIDRRRELLTKQFERDLEIEEQIELVELQEDIAAMKLAHLLTKKRI